jgi:hypothetical protein
MGTGTSNASRAGIHRLATVAAALSVGLTGVALAGCGTSHRSAFSWLHPQAPPAGWSVARLPSGAVLAYPPNWRRQHGDPGTATAALIGPAGRYLGYLNLTPRQGDETLADWTSFRLEHNREEGQRAVTRLAEANGLRFLTGHGSCLKDSYTTQTGSRFIELACLVVGTHASSVIVAAAPPNRWDKEAPVMERAISAVRT